MGLFKQTAVYGAGSVAAKSVAFLLIPLYTHYLSPSDYGEVALGFLFLSLVQHLFNYGLHVAFLKNFVQAETVPHRRTIFSTAMLSNAVTGLPLLLLLYLLTPAVSSHLSGDPVMANALYFGLASLFLDGLTTIPLLALCGLEKPVAYSSATLFAALVNLLIQTLCIVGYHWGWASVFYGQFGASVVMLLACLPVYIRFLRLEWRKEEFIRMLKFGLPYLTVTLSILLIDVSDRYILKHFTNLNTVGIYSLGYRLALAMNLWILAFQNAWPPYYLKLLKQPDAEVKIAGKLRETYVSWIILWLAYNLFLGPVVTFEWNGASLVSAAYRGGLALIPLISLAYVLYGMYLGFMVGTYVQEKSRWLNLISLAGVAFNVLGNLCLIPWAENRMAGGGMWAAAGTTIGSYLLMAVWMYFLNQRYYPLAMQWRRFALLLLITGAVFAAGWYWPGHCVLPVRILLFAGYLALTRFLGYWRWPRTITFDIG